MPWLIYNEVDDDTKVFIGCVLIACILFVLIGSIFITLKKEKMIKSPTALIAYMQEHISAGEREDIRIDDCYGWKLAFDSISGTTINFEIEYYHTADCEIRFKDGKPFVSLGEAFEGGGGEEVLEVLILEYMAIEAQSEPVLSLADQASNIAFGTDYSWIKVPKFIEPTDADYQGLYEILQAHHKKETEYLIQMCRDLAKLYVEK